MKVSCRFVSSQPELFAQTAYRIQDRMTFAIESCLCSPGDDPIGCEWNTNTANKELISSPKVFRSQILRPLLQSDT